MKNRYQKSLEKVHNLTERPRTEDVLAQYNIYFKDLLLSEAVFEGLEASGFLKPSPIQRKAIPLGKCGFDLIVQAKSGTGKTCVYTVIALEMVDPEIEKVQVLILTPTREISAQVRDVISGVGKNFKKLKVESFIGGLPLENDKKKLQKCQIAVGAPGRVKHLVASGFMKLDAVRLFVLDEADKLMESSFRQDISLIYLKLPEVKQMLAVSATFPPELENFVTRYMTNPMRVSPGDVSCLIGVRQFVSIVPSHPSVFIQLKNKMTELCRILSIISFNQCLVFSNYQSRAESICNKLNKKGWPAIHISGSLNQTTRLKAISILKEYRCRILLSTDLTSRGIDAENVNLIINLDLPYDGPTYMHRMGRAGRYGTYGMVVSIVESGEELIQFRRRLNEIGCSGSEVFMFPKEKVDFDIWQANDEHFEKFSTFNKQLKTKGKAEEIRGLTTAETEISERKEIKQKTLEIFFACHLTNNDKPKIYEYNDIMKTALQFKDEMKEKINGGEIQFDYKDYSLDLKSLILYLIKENCKEYRKNVPQKYENKNKLKSVLLFDKNKSEDSRERAVDEKRSMNFEEKFCEDLESECDTNVSYGKDNNEKNCSSESNENKEEPYDWEREDCEEAVKQSSYIKHWYFRWHSQLSAVRHYANYLKYIYYWNELNRSYEKY